MAHQEKCPLCVDGNVYGLDEETGETISYPCSYCRGDGWIIVEDEDDYCVGMGGNMYCPMTGSMVCKNHCGAY